MRSIYFLIGIMLIFALELEAQQGQVEFGKNRVQYHRRFDEWMKYESRNFVTTWYGTGRKIAETASLLAEADLAYIQAFLEYTPPEKIRIIVYTDLSDLKQTNIGNEEQFVNTAGQTLIRENKIFIYFDGNHQHLRKQIREGLVKVFIQNMIIGDNWQEMVQNAALLNLPDWYVEGLASFISDEWTPEMSLWLQENLADGKKDFFEIAEQYPGKGGHAMFYYLNLMYGKANLSNLIYLTRLNRSLDAGVVHVYGNSLEVIAEEWRTFFEKQYEKERQSRIAFDASTILKVKNRHHVPITKLKYSPDARQILYVQNEIGKVKVYIQDAATGKRKMIFKKGFRNPFQEVDYNYPCVAWRPDGQSVSIVYKYRDVIYLATYNIKNKKLETEPFAPGFQNVHSIDFVNGHTLAIAATVNGFSDIFLYYPSKRQASRVTSDIWDDVEVTYTRLRGQNGLLFVSNRPDSLLVANKLDTILPIGDFDIFYYNLDSMGKELVQITHTPFANEKAPLAIDSTWIGYLSDRSGIYNREVGFLKDEIVGYSRTYVMKDGQKIVIPKDSVLASLDTAFVDTTWVEAIWRPQAYVHPVTNFGYNILAQTYKNKHLLDLLETDNEYVVAKDSLSLTQIKMGATSSYKLERIKNSMEATPEKPSNTVLEEADTMPPSPKAEYYFVTPFGDMETETKSADEAGTSIHPSPNVKYVYVNPGPVEPFKQARITPKQIRFRMDYLTAQADNNLLFGGLDSYAGTPKEFTTPPPGILMKANFKDLLEDYEVEGGMRFNLTFNQMEYFMQYWDRKHRVDRQYGIYLRKISDTDTGNNFFVPHNVKNQTVIATTQWRYPFDIYRSLRATATMRFDRYLESSTDSISLRSPVIKDKRIGIKLAYVFDNTLDVYTNIKNGTRYKIYAELVKKYNIDFVDGLDFSLDKGYMGVLGVDARHYQRLLKHSVVASRLAAATSFGSEKLLYIMGGTDNWLIPQYNQTTPIPSENYAYRTLAASMRGFRQNIRNGNSFILFNNEIRMPVFRYISRRPLKSTFFNNIQLVGFVDAGIAWTGNDPFDLDNPLNTRELTTRDNTNTPIVHVRVKYFRDPTVLGYGLGLRTMLFGYFVRLDYAWGVETRVVQKPKIYLSMGTDF